LESIFQKTNNESKFHFRIRDGYASKLIVKFLPKLN